MIRPEDFNWSQWQSDPRGTYSYRTVTPEEFENAILQARTRQEAAKDMGAKIRADPLGVDAMIQLLQEKVLA